MLKTVNLLLPMWRIQIQVKKKADAAVFPLRNSFYNQSNNQNNFKIVSFWTVADIFQWRFINNTPIYEITVLKNINV